MRIFHIAQTNGYIQNPSAGCFHITLMKYFSLLLLIVLCVFQFQIWQPHSGLLQKYADIQKEAQAVQQENKLLRHRNQMLAAEVNDLKEGFDTTAEIARSELGFIEKGEILYKLKHD
jgi:cell division protein ftsB homolog